MPTIYEFERETGLTYDKALEMIEEIVGTVPGEQVISYHLQVVVRVDDATVEIRNVCSNG